MMLLNKGVSWLVCDSGAHCLTLISTHLMLSVATEITRREFKSSEPPAAAPEAGQEQVAPLHSRQG